MATVNKSKTENKAKTKGIRAVWDSLKKKQKKPTQKAADKQSKIVKTDETVLKIGTLPYVLVKPHITEKSAYGASLHKYTFEVPLYANKNQVRAALKALYSVKAESVHIIKRKGKNVRFHTKQGKKKDKKFAVITVQKDVKLDIYETA